MDKVAVLIPCYNEAATIKKVVEDFKRVLPEGGVIYVYDNNSKDGTAEIARAAGAVVRHEYQQGKGNVIRRMFREIDAECYLMADGDDTYPAEHAPEMIDLVLNRQVDMVVGDRLSSTYFGYRAFSYQFVKSFPVLSKGFEIETEMSIHAVDKNMSVENVIIDYRDRPEGSESKLNTVSDGFKVIKTIIRLFRTYKPFAFFSLLALVLVILSALFFVPVLVDYFRTGLVERFPTLIVCGFVIIAAVQSFFAGLILENIQQKNRQDFEMNLIRLSENLK